MRQFEEYGESILQKLDLVSHHPDLQKDWVPASLTKCLHLLEENANKIIERASSPVKIGLMGEFSAGKTLLLGSLIGYADALPATETPSTGNVTAIHLVQQEDFQTTQFNPFTVKYLSHEGVKECLSFMLKEAEKQATAAGVNPPRLNPRDGDVWNDILRWSETAWNSTSNPDLRLLLRELVLFARTYGAYGAALCDTNHQIDTFTAKEGLQLAEPPMEIQTLSFDDLPPAPVPLQHPPQKLEAKLLQLSFLLIRRIDAEIRVAKEIWNLSTLQGAKEFVLLDFPGLGASNSSVRDTFLSLRELAEVQTILILLNGKSPGSDRANRIFTMMQQHKGRDIKDRILVGVGRFDELPLKNDGGERVLDDLIGENVFPRKPVLEETVFQQLNVLRTTIAGVQTFTTQKDRILLLSPLLGLADLAKHSTIVQAGSQEWLANLSYPGFLDESKRLQEKWGHLSERLLESEPHSTLGRQLGYFAQDGGIGKLRELIQTHVAAHGLKQLYEDTESIAQALRSQQNNLKRILEEIKQQGIPVPDSTAFVNLRQTIANLVTIYQEFQNDLGKKPIQDRHRGIDMSDVIYDELTFKIFNWDQWNIILQRAENGIIKRPESTSILDDLFPDLDKPEDSNNFPTKSDDFYPVFQQTVQDLEKFTRTRLRQAITDLLNQFSAQMAEPRNKLTEILPPEKVKEQIEHIRQKYGSARLLQILVGRATNPELFQEEILRRCELQKDSQSTIQTETIFPLASGDSSNQGSQIFEWGRDSEDSPRPFNHQILVLRLRDEMIASVGLHLVQLVSETNQKLNDTLGELLKQLIDVLQSLSKNENLLRDIVAEEIEPNPSGPAWLQILSQISSISYPD